ncbi:CidA/LrgA family protein [Brevibacillus migulae]|uniref:CidA/LrgA family protein n=1 Tax=Brevibacillus migulae TaxID=1644114 RepID=UPI00106E168B|nr:CidA/LrgA family holin-like protein [Brevibacillus migulae]
MLVLIKSLIQIGFLLVFSCLMNQLASWLPIHIPGSILGIIVLFFLLQTKIIRLEWVDLGAKWLLAELLLLFVPSAVGIMQYKEILQHDGLRLILVVVISTVVTMACTGVLAQRMGKRKERKLS